MLPTAAQTISSFTAPGQNDLYSDVLLCSSGYITNSHSSLLSSFACNDNLATSKNVGAEWFLSDCLKEQSSINRIGNAVIETINNAVENSTNPTRSTCHGSTTQFSGYTIQCDATNLVTQACDAFKRNIDSTLKPCMNNDAIVSRSWAIPGIVIGATAAVSLIVFAAIYLPMLCKKRNKSCC